MSRYIVMIEDDGTRDVPEIVRLRHLLKQALRAFQLRAVEVTEVEAPPVLKVLEKTRHFLQTPQGNATAIA